MRVGFVAAFAAMIGAAAPATAAACDCEVIDLEDAYAGAHAVFVGVERQRPAANAPYPRATVYEVERSWKGARTGERVTLWDFGSSCDVAGASRESPSSDRWLVFAQLGAPGDGARAGRLFGDHCGNPVFHWRTSWDQVLATVDASADAGAGRGAVFRAGCDTITSADVDARVRGWGEDRAAATDALVRALLVRREARRRGIAVSTDEEIDAAVTAAAGRPASEIYDAIRSGRTGVPAQGVDAYRRAIADAILERRLEARIRTPLEPWLAAARARAPSIRTRTRTGRCVERTP